MDNCTEEIQQAEQYWIKRTQSDSFPKEMNGLLKNANVDRHSKIISLKPFLDECGLLRIGGRLQETNWSFTQKHPYILPGNDALSELLIRKAHEDVMHSEPIERNILDTEIQADDEELCQALFNLQTRTRKSRSTDQCTVTKRPH
jgi:hypothetical protein